jgi:hypothetical protein
MAAEEEASIAELWARAAHDLRQPVQAALLLSKMLDGAEAPPDMRRAARHIGTSLSSLYGAEVLAAPVRETTKVAVKWGVALRTRNLSGAVKSNPQLLAMATKSLLLKAIKFGSGDAIVAGCRRRGDALAIEVRFRGAIDPSEETAFFEVATRAAGTRSSELGIGRLLLERLCRRLGHSLDETRSPPDHRRLALWLPRATP